MSDDAPAEPTPPASPEPDWTQDEYLTSGRRFVRWNLVTLVLGVVVLAAGVAVHRTAAPGAKAPAPPAQGE